MVPFEKHVDPALFPDHQICTNTDPKQNYLFCRIAEPSFKAVWVRHKLINLKTTGIRNIIATFQVFSVSLMLARTLHRHIQPQKQLLENLQEPTQTNILPANIKTAIYTITSHQNHSSAAQILYTGSRSTVKSLLGQFTIWKCETLQCDLPAGENYTLKNERGN